MFDPPATVTPEHPGSPLSALLGLVLLCAYFVLFTVGSQVPSSDYQHPKTLFDAMMFVFTLRETSIALLGILASCLGTWRRRNQDPIDAKIPWYLAYISACISGMFMAGLAIGLPSAIGLSKLFELTRVQGLGQQNYVSMALLGSFVAFLSGYDKTLFDRVTKTLASKLGVDTNSTSISISKPAG